MWVFPWFSGHEQIVKVSLDSVMSRVQFFGKSREFSQNPKQNWENSVISGIELVTGDQLGINWGSTDRVARCFCKKIQWHRKSMPWSKFPNEVRNMIRSPCWLMSSSGINILGIINRNPCETTRNWLFERWRKASWLSSQRQNRLFRLTARSQWVERTMPFLTVGSSLLMFWICYQFSLIDVWRLLHLSPNDLTIHVFG